MDGSYKMKLLIVTLPLINGDLHWLFTLFFFDPWFPYMKVVLIRRAQSGCKIAVSTWMGRVRLRMRFLRSHFLPLPA